ncbi:hypothetical protein DespoDRAFT_03586 [Desulfobacter postgatei 2ac9]|uniref:Uncharacterized protein n=1 Tax=Desulfobacter postgatei 2ac9 TaxID=879212 RepID=I5B777_9BACT|nr:hypothetical protein DespoDRAFT_03586 [Desulfobacter postgatei 2ac9]
MKIRFSSRELFDLRNNIPVDMLIRDQLQIPRKSGTVFFVFYAPSAMNFRQRLIRTPIWPGASGVKEISTPLIWS